LLHFEGKRLDLREMQQIWMVVFERGQRKMVLFFGERVL
jgi:hypothetical protein